MVEVGAFWSGERMTKIQELCFKSFIRHGHTVNLFVYGERDDIPPGIIIRDANEIMPFDNIGHIAHFSDVFRYKMVKKTGLGWIDADTLCLTKDWTFPGGHFVIVNDANEIANSIFSLPQDSEILDYIIELATAIDRSSAHWEEPGHRTLTKAFNKYPEYRKYLVSEKESCGIYWTEWEKLWDPKYRDKMIRLSKTIKSFSIYNEAVSRSGRDRNNFPAGSALEYFYNKFVGN